MRRLIFTDVHANLPAFQAVLNAAGSWDEAWFLGDIVGWGPNPGECLDLLKQIRAVCIKGNHDAMICKLKPGMPGNFMWDEWTYSLLDEEQLAFLDTMLYTYSHEEEGILTTLIHSPFGIRYLKPQISAEEMALAFNDIKGDRILCGHSHHLIERNRQGRSYICIRSVGQPRDADPRAGYSIEEDGIIKHFRVEYNVDQVISDIYNIGLESHLLNRVIHFIKTGYDREWSRLD